MATLNFGGFETGDSLDANATTGTFSIQGSVTVGAWSAWALRTNPTTTGTGFHRIRKVAATGVGSDNFAVASIYSRFYFRYDTKPASGDEPFAALASASVGSTAEIELRLNSSGQIVVYTWDGSTVTGSATLNQNTWYRIEQHQSVAANEVITWSVKVNGTVDVSGVTSEFSGVSLFNNFFLGKTANRNSQSVDFYYDDWHVSDSAYPGAGQCGILIPNANGNYQAWTIGAGADHYTSVDEIPHDSDTTYLVSTLTDGHAETEALQPASTHSISGTINCVKSFAILKRDGASNGAARLRTRSGSTDSDTSSNYASTSAYALIAKLFNVDPADSAAWTTGDLDALETGAVEKSTTQKTRLTLTGAMVDWTPAAGGGGDHPAVKRMGGVQFAHNLGRGVW